MFTTLQYKTREKKVQLAHSLAPALTLTQTFDRLANKPQQTTSIMFCLMYPTTAQWTNYKYVHSDYNINVLFI